ncbi:MULTISPECIES: NAD(P)/FAD-dependent oxidoreductase [Halorussus]|uniref:NAD(P)/FAD-dependent oxidoreductase n=1 Tax=Halorussus TaxID=1070314 RepID=UPI000E21A6DE|nr:MULTISPECIES: FAD-dependent oxidoreductase [Halorussus]NHN57578.1 FAD-dependent oxidoreductase [Halorussus sp. JP-T4]
MSEDQHYDVIIVGGGVAGRSAAIYTARHGLVTGVLDAGGSILRRNARLENYPGFPAGVDARLLLDSMRDQVEQAGGEFREAEVAAVRRAADAESFDADAGGPVADAADSDESVDGRFDVETTDGDRYRTDYVVAATKNATDYLDPLDPVELVDRGKAFVETDERGRTGVEGLYAAGRLAGKPHQAVVAAGHGAEVAVTLLEDDDRPFYHDWVAPEGYFTGRGREVPPGCEEIGDEERRRREDESLDAMREYFADPHPDGPENHPSVAADDE